jgi:hypothetical protein
MHLDLTQECIQPISSVENTLVSSIRNGTDANKIMTDHFCDNADNLLPIITFFRDNQSMFLSDIWMKRTTRWFLIQKALNMQQVDGIVWNKTAQAIRTHFNIDLLRPATPNKTKQTPPIHPKENSTKLQTQNIHQKISPVLKQTVNTYYDTIMKWCDCGVNDVYAISLIESNGGQENKYVYTGSGWLGLTATGVAGAIQYLQKNTSLKQQVIRLHPNLSTLLDTRTSDPKALIQHAETHDTRRKNNELNTILWLVILKQNTEQKTQKNMKPNISDRALRWAKKFAKHKHINTSDIQTMYDKIKNNPQLYEEKLKNYIWYNGSKHKNGYALFALTASELLQKQDAQNQDPVS